MFLRKLVCSLGCLVFLSFPARAQNPQNPPAAGGEAPETILAGGAVRSAQGRGIPGATLRLTELASGRAWVTWTDENGKFEPPGLPAGRYRVEADQIGFESTTKEIEITAQSPAIDLTLSIAALPAVNRPLQPQAPANPSPAGASPAQAPANPNPAGASPVAKAKTPKNARAGAKPTRQREPGWPWSGNDPHGPPVAANTIRQREPGWPWSDIDALESAEAEHPGLAPGDVAEMTRQRRQLGGFQDVGLGRTGASQDAGVPADAGPAGPLGDESSSDAFLISGTVGRGATQGDAGTGPFGSIGPFSGVGGEGAFPAPGGPGG